MIKELGLLPTIASDDEVKDDGSSSDDDDEAVVPRKRQRKAGGNRKKASQNDADFSSSFHFDHDASLPQSRSSIDGLHGRLRAVAKGNSTVDALDRRIAAARQQRRKTDTDNDGIDADLELNEDDAQSDVSVDDDVDVERLDKSDTVKQKVKRSGKKDFFDTSFSADVGGSKAETLTFQEMNLSRPLLKAISLLGFVHPTPIQAACVPVALSGKDVCACAATGTGKTAAYMLPILERLLYKPKAKSVTRVLVLVPTRELAIQVFQVGRNLAQHTNVEISLSAGRCHYYGFYNIVVYGIRKVICTTTTTSFHF